MLLGESFTDQAGRKRLSGHTLRILGSRRLVRLSFLTVIFMLLGRWGSDVVLSYIREAPRKGLANGYRRRAEPTKYSLQDLAHSLDGRRRETIQKHSDKYAEHERRLLALAGRVDNLDTRLEVPDYVQNRFSGIYHRADTACMTIFATRPRHTPCGWAYDSSNAVPVKSLPPGAGAVHFCGRYLRRERQAATFF